MFTEITEEGIKELVHRFYGKVVRDPELGPVFNRAIEKEAWPEHLDKMCDFWSAVMLKTGRYGGNPAQKHRDLPPFEAELFERWLALFSETARELFSEETASRFEYVSRNIARNLKYMLYM